jgi:TRAP transporter 4TM/12TM fusion protein
MQNEATSGIPASQPAGPVYWLITTLAVALACLSIAWSMDVFRDFGLQLYTEQFLAAMLAVAFPLTYLQVPAARGRERSGPVPWYDWIAVVLGFCAAAYAAVRFPELVDRMHLFPADAVAVGLIFVVLIIEGVRRTVGTILAGVVVVFILFGLFGHLIPGTLAGRYTEWIKLSLFLSWDPTSILGTPLRIVSTVVIAFVFFGHILFKSGGSSFFTDISMVLMGRYRGGPAKIAILASSLFGSISGSVVSNVLTTGIVTIPLMRKGGYKDYDAGAIEAVASTGGQLMPPIMGAAAFLMAEFLQITYTEVVIAALIPSILYYVVLFIQADLEAARRDLARVPDNLIPKAGPVMRAGWYFPIPFIVLITAMFWFNYSPEAAALISAATVILFGLIFGYEGKRLELRVIFDALRETGITSLDIVMIGGGVGIVIGVLNISGLGFGLTLFLVQAAGGNLIVLLLMSAVVCIILGMGMPTVGVYVLLAALVAPALIEVGINPIAAHMFIMYFGMMSMITPPVAIGAFAAATLTGADPMRTGFAAMRFGWLAFIIPFMFVGSTTLLMQGTPAAIATDCVLALVGSCMVSYAVMGYFRSHLGWPARVIFAIGGLCLLTPFSAFTGARLVNIFGAAMVILIAVDEFGLKRKLQSLGAPVRVAPGGT